MHKDSRLVAYAPDDREAKTGPCGYWQHRHLRRKGPTQRVFFRCLIKKKEKKESEKIILLLTVEVIPTRKLGGAEKAVPNFVDVTLPTRASFRHPL